jgi:hypothetical protein
VPWLSESIQRTAAGNAEILLGQDLIYTRPVQPAVFQICPGKVPAASGAKLHDQVRAVVDEGLAAVDYVVAVVVYGLAYAPIKGVVGIIDRFVQRPRIVLGRTGKSLHCCQPLALVPRILGQAQPVGREFPKRVALVIVAVGVVLGVVRHAFVIARIVLLKSCAVIAEFVVGISLVGLVVVVVISISQPAGVVVIIVGGLGESVDKALDRRGVAVVRNAADAVVRPRVIRQRGRSLGDKTGQVRLW